MTPDSDLDDLKRILNAIPLLVTDEDLYKALMEDVNSKRVRTLLQDHGFPDDEEARKTLAIILQKFYQSQTSIQVPTTSGVSSFDQQYVAQFRDLLMESFYNIRWTYHVSLGMSITMFIIGVVLMFIAVASAYGTEEFSMSTFTIAGLSLADFFFLFYTRPWQDVAKGLSNAQQVKMVIYSYLAGNALIRANPDKTSRLDQLIRLTHHSLYLLETYAEPG